MGNIKENPIIKKLINVEKKLYYHTLNAKLEKEAAKRKNGWVDSRYTLLQQYKDKYNGQRCFIIGMGPSLTEADLNAVKNEYTFGMNSLALRFEEDPWRPDFYGVQDIYVYPKLEKALLKESKRCNKKTTFFVGSTICDKYKVPNNWVKYPLNAAYHKYEARIYKYFAKASDDCYSVVYDGYSITYSLVQLAMYMGFSEIYLLGTDCSYEKNKQQHFIEYGYQDKNYLTVGESMIVAYGYLKQLSDKLGVHIFNATRGGMLEVFPRVKLEDVLK